MSLSDAARVLCVPGSAPGRRLRHELERRQPYHAVPLWTRTKGGHRRVSLAALRRECPDLFHAADAARLRIERQAEDKLVKSAEIRLGEQLELFVEAVRDVTRVATDELREAVEDIKADLRRFVREIVAKAIVEIRAAG